MFQVSNWKCRGKILKTYYQENAVDMEMITC